MYVCIYVMIVKKKPHYASLESTKNKDSGIILIYYSCNGTNDIFNHEDNLISDFILLIL